MNKIYIDKEKCVHCGACTAACGSDSLRLEGKDCTLSFDKDRCKGCESCIKACPLRAITVDMAIRWLYV